MEIGSGTLRHFLRKHGSAVSLIGVPGRMILERFPLICGILETIEPEQQSKGTVRPTGEAEGTHKRRLLLNISRYIIWETALREICY